MALFSRRKKTDDADLPLETGADAAAVAPSQTESSAAPSETVTQAPASVGISMSSFRGLGTADAPAPAPEPAPVARTLPAAEAPAPTETIPGLRDNVVLRAALSKVSAPPAQEELIEVARQLLQGHVFLRVKGDARTLLAEGKDVPLGIATVGDKQFVLAYSSGDALRASLQEDRDTDTSAMGQPVLTVLRYVLDGPYAGLVIDQSSAPARAVLPRELLQKIVDQADETLEIKTLLSSERTEATASAIAEALTHVKVWVAVNKSADGRFGVAEAHTSDGGRYVELYSHPLELAVLGRSDQPAPMQAAQLGAALRADEQLSGVIIDPGGPWIRLSRAELAPLMALAEPQA